MDISSAEESRRHHNSLFSVRSHPSRTVLTALARHALIAHHRLCSITLSLQHSYSSEVTIIPSGSNADGTTRA